MMQAQNNQQPAQGAQGAAHPQYSGHAQRLASFEGWPYEHIVSMDILARNGLFWQGQGFARCWKCGVDLLIRNWNQGDDPQDVHYLVMKFSCHDAVPGSFLTDAVCTRA